MHKFKIYVYIYQVIHKTHADMENTADIWITTVKCS